MSFLSRRKHRRRDDPGQSPSLAADLSLGALPEDDAASVQAPSLLPTPSIRSTTNISIRKRLSSLSFLAGGLKRGRPQHAQTPSQVQSQTQGTGLDGSVGAGLGFVMPVRIHSPSRSRSPSPEPSLEIRRPSGLGRRASVIELFEQPEEARADGVYGHGAGERKHSMSTPELVMLPNGLLHWSHLPEKAHPRRDSSSKLPFSKLKRRISKTLPPIPPPAVSLAQMPPGLLETILSYTRPKDVASAAAVCKALAEPAKAVLYANINLTGTVNDSQRENCICLLASRRDLGALVHSFACSDLPYTSESPLAKGRSKYSLVTVAIALNTMPSLTSLTLPRFDTSLLSYTSFRLRKLCFLCERMTNDDLQNTFEWLISQSTITLLSLPNLVLDDSNTQLLSHTSAQHSSIPEDAVEDQAAWTIPSQVLPFLDELCGPAALVAALTPGRPLASVRLHVHSTVYDGLRPSALASALAQSTAESSITRLTLVAVSHADCKIDARTTERVLMSIGSELGQTVQVLEVESTLEDEVRTNRTARSLVRSNCYEQVIRKLVGPVLSRYKALHTLRLRGKIYPPPPTPPPSEPPLETPSDISIEFPSMTISLAPTLPSLSLGLGSPFTLPFPSEPSPTFLTPLPSPLSPGAFSDVSAPASTVMTPLPSPVNDGPCGSRTQERDRTILASWTRHCPSLRTVVFPSAARWTIVPSTQEQPADRISPAFTFIFEGAELSEFGAKTP